MECWTFHQAPLLLYHTPRQLTLFEKCIMCQDSLAGGPPTRWFVKYNIHAHLATLGCTSDPPPS